MVPNYRPTFFVRSSFVVGKSSAQRLRSLNNQTKISYSANTERRKYRWSKGAEFGLKPCKFMPEAAVLKRRSIIRLPPCRRQTCYSPFVSNFPELEATSSEKIERNVCFFIRLSIPISLLNLDTYFCQALQSCQAKSDLNANLWLLKAIEHVWRELAVLLPVLRKSDWWVSTNDAGC